jgi:hypothetical protein
MALPGYDRDDIEAWLQGLVSRADAAAVLDDEELEAYQNGERLEDALSSQTVTELQARDRE